MDRKTKLIVSGFLFVFFYFSVFIPYLHNREATRVVMSVLNAWSTNDFVKAFDGWEIQQQSPPIYGVTSWTILKKIFDRQDGVRHAQFLVFIKFNPGVDMPLEKVWVFELKKTRLGWKIVDFHLSQNQSIDK